jgi:hypothetical protein
MAMTFSPESLLTSLVDTTHLYITNQRHTRRDHIGTGNTTNLKKSKIKTGTACRVSQSGNTTMIPKCPTIENHLRDSLTNGPLGDQLSNLLGSIDIPTEATRPGDLCLHRAGGNQRSPLLIVDDLSIHVTIASENRQPRPSVGIADNAIPHSEFSTTTLFNKTLASFHNPTRSLCPLLLYQPEHRANTANRQITSNQMPCRISF